LAQSRNHPTAATTYDDTLAQPKENHMQPVTEDPFAALYSPSPSTTQPTTSLYISGRLTLLRVPQWLNPGEWIQFPNNLTHSAWHRRLTPNAFLWLRTAVNRAIESGRITEEFSDASQILEQIAEIGIEHGVLTAEEIESYCRPPDDYSFNEGIPVWADGI